MIAPSDRPLAHDTSRPLRRLRIRLGSSRFHVERGLSCGGWERNNGDEGIWPAVQSYERGVESLHQAAYAGAALSLQQAVEPAGRGAGATRRTDPNFELARVRDAASARPVETPADGQPPFDAPANPPGSQPGLDSSTSHYPADSPSVPPLRSVQGE